MKNKRGFTLIELLAVIIIMGVLMWTAIASYTRIIENSRRDTFATNAKNYINTVRTSVLADEITCYAANGEGTGSSYAALGNGTYIFYLATDKSAIGDTNVFEKIPNDTIVTNTNDLMESGGKSSWGNNNVWGYVIWNKTANGSSIKTTYSIFLRDTAGHGLTAETEEEKISRTNVSATASVVTAGAQTRSVVFDTTINYVCKLS